MIQFSAHTLANGLQVICHEDDSTPMAAFNLLYDVGARDESPERTGFAHLFEHLMFGGSAHAPDFDSHLQLAGGESNAFTNNDITNFYDIVPAENLETVFWLESDRMAALKLTEKALNTQRKVVLEEFKETCTNQPYGDVWHHLMELVYHKHPYRWPTIGLVPEHIKEANLEDVRGFFSKYYKPNNAILVVAGKVNTGEVLALAEKWFGDIKSNVRTKRQLPEEPLQTAFRSKIVEADVPSDAIYMAFRVPARMDAAFFAVDMLSDILSNGDSSRLYRRLKKERKLFADIDAYVTASFDPGLLVIEGKVADGIEMAAAENAIWEILEEMKHEAISDDELQKHKRRLESSTVFSECNVLNKAINLAYYAAAGNADFINEEMQHYLDLTPDDLQLSANKFFIKENCSTLYYLSKTK
jgi:zinc protease